MPAYRPSLAYACALGLLAAACGGVDKDGTAVVGGPGHVVKTDGGAPAVDAADATMDGASEAAETSERPGQSLACGNCETTKCNNPDWVADVNAGEDFIQDPYALCFAPVDSNGKPAIAANGPATGKNRADLCKAVIDCVHATGCRITSIVSTPAGPSMGYDCYCGAGVSTDDCISPALGKGPRGACKDIIERASETTTPIEVGQVRYDTSVAAGAANFFLLHCESHIPDHPNDPPGVCEDVCTSSAPADAGTDGDGGGGSVSGGGGATGTGGASGTGGGGTGGFDGACAGGVASYQGLGVAESAAYGTDTDTLNLFTATHDTRAEDAVTIPVGWGPSTLSSPQQQHAATLLISRIVALLPGSVRTGTNAGPFVSGTSTGIPNATNGLLIVGAAASDLIAGMNLAGVSSAGAIDGTVTALDAYIAAAIADATGPQGPGLPPGLPAPDVASQAGRAALGAYISKWATDPTSAIGIADNVVNYAVKAGLTELRDAPCPASGDGGTTGSAGTAGSAGATGSAGTGGQGGGGGSTGADAAVTFDVGAAGTEAAACPDLDGNGVSDCTETLTSLSGPTAVRNTDIDQTHATDGRTIAAASRCLAAHAGERYVVAVQVSVAPEQAGGWADFAIDEFTSGDCTGTPAALPYLSPQIFAAASAQTLRGTTTQVPLGVSSLALRLRAVKPVAQPSFEAVFDHLVVHLLGDARGP